MARDEERGVVVLAAAQRFAPGHNLKGMLRSTRIWPGTRTVWALQPRDAYHPNLPVPVIARAGHGHGGGLPAGGAMRPGRGQRGRQLCHQRHPRRPVLRHAQRALVRNVPTKRAMEMLLTGDFIDAHGPGAGAGEPRRGAPAADVEVELLVQSIVEKPRAAVAMGKALVYQQRELGLEAAYQLAGQPWPAT